MIKPLLEETDIDLLCLHECVEREHIIDALTNVAPPGDEKTENDRRTLTVVIEQHRADPAANYRMMVDVHRNRTDNFDLEWRRIPLRYLALRFQKKPAPPPNF